MNRWQRGVLWIAVSLVVLLGLFPPTYGISVIGDSESGEKVFRSTPRPHFVFSDARILVNNGTDSRYQANRIDYAMLVMLTGAIAIAATGGFFLLRDHRI